MTSAGGEYERLAIDSGAVGNIATPVLSMPTLSPEIGFATLATRWPALTSAIPPLTGPVADRASEPPRASLPTAVTATRPPPAGPPPDTDAPFGPLEASPVPEAAAPL